MFQVFRKYSFRLLPELFRPEVLHPDHFLPVLELVIAYRLSIPVSRMKTFRFNVYIICAYTYIFSVFLANPSYYSLCLPQRSCLPSLFTTVYVPSEPEAFLPDRSLMLEKKFRSNLFLAFFFRNCCFRPALRGHPPPPFDQPKLIKHQKKTGYLFPSSRPYAQRSNIFHAAKVSKPHFFR